MSESPSPDLHALPPEQVRALDQVCDRFEAACKAGQQPRLEDYLGEVPGPARNILKRELLALEQLYRNRMQVTLSVTTGPHEGLEFRFAGHDTFLVGRSKQAHFRLAGKDKYFSRIHFMVEVNPPQCRLMDLKSRNGTYVNGHKVTTTDLHDGDLIKAGRTILRVSVHGGESEAAGPSASAARDMVATASYQTCGGETAPIGVVSVPSVPAPAPQPQPISGYQVVRELGRGGMGVVYLALRLASGMPVALKTITPQSAGTRNQVERFLREANILRELDHPNIVAFRDMGQADGLFYFAMDYVHGTDLGKLVKAEGALAIGRAVGLVCQLLGALEYAHARGFVHRDIKPSNLLVKEEKGHEVVMLADFGLARVYQGSALSGLTMTGDVGGTTAFMPPEQISNFREARPPADQYAAGATLYKLLTGKYVHDLPREFEKQLLMIMQEPPVAILTRRPDLPRDLAILVHRSLAKNPEKRFTDVGAMRQALLPFAVG